MQNNKSNGQLTAQINVSDHKKSGFDLSNNVLGTGKIGRIIPTRALHVMPGDTIKQDSKCAVQFEPLAVPILANMDVKQEHFYVPYNIVWKNWDKFISGGEKMDYQGVVPNTNFYNMLIALNTLLFRGSQPANELIFKFQALNKGATERYLDLVFDGHAEGYKQRLKGYLDGVSSSFNVKDLLHQQYYLIDHLHDYLGDNSYFYLFEPSGAVMDTESSLKQYLRSTYDNVLHVTGNKYMEEVFDWIVWRYWNGINSASTPLYLPTESGMKFLTWNYEYIKNLVGIGSNIDYLNMGRLTMQEFLIATMLHMQISTLADGQIYYYDLPVEGVNKEPKSILHLRANYSVWYNNYRDILLEADAFEPHNEDYVTNNELFALLIPRQRCWEKDAFTTALDNPGTGNVGVPVGASVGWAGNYKINKVNNYEYNPEPNPHENNIVEVEYDGEKWKLPTAFLSGISPIMSNEGTVSVEGFSLYALDAAKRAQSWLQKALFFGNRISDFYYLRYGVRYLDARLRLPELLTSSSELVRIDAIMNNTTTAESIAGDRAGFASAYDNGNSFDRFCEEHGVILSYLTIMPQVTYAYGMSRDYARLDQFDFAFSEFATLGMDAVYDSEITASCLDGINPVVFGYQGKYYDYKSKHSEEHGELLDSQDMYTFSRKFNMWNNEQRPKLNYEFVHCFPDLDMFVVEDPTQDIFRFDIRHSTAAERGLPSQSIYI